MRSRGWRVITVITVLVGLLVPAVGAVGADQEVDLSVIPADTLSIDVEPSVGFPQVVPGGSTMEAAFGMNITNTTANGWQVSVVGTDLHSYYWESCDETGCYNRLPTDPSFTIPASSIYLTGGGVSWMEEGVVTYYEGPLGGTEPLLLMVATADAYGSFGMDNPNPTVKVNVPGDAAVADYWATLTYTVESTP